MPLKGCKNVILTRPAKATLVISCVQWSIDSSHLKLPGELTVVLSLQHLQLGGQGRASVLIVFVVEIITSNLNLQACPHVVYSYNLATFLPYNAGPFIVTLYLSVNDFSIPVPSTLGVT